MVIHLVFTTKCRHKILEPHHLERMREVCLEVGRKMGFTVLELNGEMDHVHLLVEYAPTLSVSSLVNHLKGGSSRMLRKEFGLRPHQDPLWSPRCFAGSCGGAPIRVVREYIEQQGKKPA
ncbi:MAG: IS200/IS605 family transposase [Cyanophyceae cyanobacterium]